MMYFVEGRLTDAKATYFDGENYDEVVRILGNSYAHRTQGVIYFKYQYTKVDSVKLVLRPGNWVVRDSRGNCTIYDPESFSLNWTIVMA